MLADKQNNKDHFSILFRPYQDGSLVIEVHLGDVMDLICPFYDEQQSYMTSELEQYDIYRVCLNIHRQKKTKQTEFLL